MKERTQEHHYPPEVAIDVATQILEEDGVLVRADQRLRVSKRSFRSPRCDLYRGGTLLGGGKGKGPGSQAGASALFEAIEHVAARGHLYTADPSVTIRLADAFKPRRADTLWKYAERISRTAGPIECVPFRRVDRLGNLNPAGREYYFPRASSDYSYQDYSLENPLLYLRRYSTTNGYAAGTSFHDALMHAVNEVVERDAHSLQLLRDYCGGAAGWEILPPFPTPEAAVIEYLESSGCSRPRLAHVPSEAGYTIYSWCCTSDGSHIYGWGTSSYSDVAVERSVGELLQEYWAKKMGVTPSIDNGEEHPLFERFPALLNASKLRPPYILGSLSFEQWRGESRPLPDAVNGLMTAGYDVLARTIWTPAPTRAPTVTVVQVVVPGLEAFNTIGFGRALLPTGRLYSRAIHENLLKDCEND